MRWRQQIFLFVELFLVYVRRRMQDCEHFPLSRKSHFILWFILLLMVSRPRCLILNWKLICQHELLYDYKYNYDDLTKECNKQPFTWYCVKNNIYPCFKNETWIPILSMCLNNVVIYSRHLWKMCVSLNLMYVT